jgi:hypothetical protein
MESSCFTRMRSREISVDKLKIITNYEGIWSSYLFKWFLECWSNGMMEC